MNNLLKKTYKIIIIIFDLFLINFSYITAFFIKFGFDIPFFNLEPYLKAMPFISMAALIYFDVFGIIKFYRKTVYETLISLVKLVLLLSITTVSITYFLQGFSFPRSVLIISTVIMFLYLSIWRGLLVIVRRKFSKEIDVMLVGNDMELVSIAEKIKASAHKIKIKYAFDLDDIKLVMMNIPEVDEVFLCPNIPDDIKIRIITNCIEKKKVVYAVPQLFEISLVNTRIVHFEDMPTFIIDRLGLTTEQRFFKRVFDIILSFVGLIISSPILLVSAFMIKLSSRGPIVYKQERITYNNNIFNIYKLRTMKTDAETKTGPVISSQDDPRVTTIGKFLRKYKIDELPQLFNILKGDMSFVGPRPERPYFVKQFYKEIPDYKYRLLVKAGLTGYAQVFGKYDSSAENKLRYDLLYLRNYSLLLDIKLVLNTFFVFFKGKNNYQKVPESVDETEQRSIV